MTDDHRLPDPFPAVRRLPLGSVVILRHYDHPNRRDLARRLARLCRQRRIRLMVANDFALARDLGCGLHVPNYRLQTLGPRIRLWSQSKSTHWLSAACHTRQALEAAERAGADFCLLSPIFPTASHPGAPTLGTWRFRLWLRSSPLPVYALGGVNRQTIGLLTGSQAAGCAAIGGLR